MKIDKQDIRYNFEEITKGFSTQEAMEEANRCLYCYDAPCIKACPTSIDIPTFIRKIATENIKGSAKVIMDANPIGATCSRVCPVEELCEGACVLNQSTKPILIGMLQRFATDYIREKELVLYKKPQGNKKKVAIIGAGPSGLAAARELALLGYSVDMYEAEKEAGGLNRYGIVSFRLPLAIPRWEIQQIKQLGVTIYEETEIGRDIPFKEIQEKYDAVIIAIGLGAVPNIGVENESLLMDALTFIKETKLGMLSNEVKGKKVVVIGAGNTAIDAATCATRLGAEKVTIMYRRTEKEMTAYSFEYELAKQHGIAFQFLSKPIAIRRNKKSIQLEWLPMKTGKVDADGRKMVEAASTVPFIENVDMVIKAIGQEKLTNWIENSNIHHQKGVIKVDDNYETNQNNVFACGDCIFEKGVGDATVVTAVAQGKKVAQAVHMKLQNSQLMTQGGV